MDLRDYLRALRRRAWIPVALVLATVLSAGALTLLSRPTYTATTAVFASAPGSGSGLGSASLLSVSFPQTVTSSTLALGVIQKLKLDESPDQLISQIRVGVGVNNLYPLSVSDPDPYRAIRLANEVAAEAVVLYGKLAAQAGNAPADQALLTARDRLGQAYVAAALARLKFQLQHPGAISTTSAPPKDAEAAAQALQLQLQEDVAATAYRNVLAQISSQGLNQLSQARDFNAFVLDPAVARPDSGARVPAILFAAVLALMIGIGLVFFLEHLDTKSIREPDAVEEMVGAPVIGIVPRATAQSLRPPKEGAG